MRIVNLKVLPGHRLQITTAEGTTGVFDVSSYLDFEAFVPLKSEEEFKQISNGGYFVEWACGADLSADTIEAGMGIMRAPEEPHHA